MWDKDRIRLIFLCLAVGSLWVWSWNRTQPPFKGYSRAQFLMDTLVEITVVDSDADRAKKVVEKAFQEIRRIEGLLNRYNLQDQAFQRGYGEERSLHVDDEVGSLLKRAIAYGDLSGGAFDITVGVLTKLWGFNEEVQRIPDVRSLYEVLPLVNYKNLKLSPDGKTIYLKKPGIILDLGGIARGYALDRALEVIRDNGIRHALVKTEGDFRMMGHSPEGTAWQIGIPHPRDRSALLGVLTTTDNAVVTLGDYQKFFIEGKVRYHHLLNPKDGMPANQCQSVTLLAETAEKAEALATAVFILGPQKGLELIERLPDVEGLILDERGYLLPSSGFETLNFSWYPSTS